MGKTADVESDAGLGLAGFLAPAASAAASGEGDQSPSQSDTKVEPEAEASVAPEKAVETPAKDAVAAAEPVKAESEKKVEPEKPSINWEADDNPYKKRYTDTANYATKVNQDNQEIKRRLDILGKKVDGTYDPATDEVVAGPSPVEIEHNALLRGKVAASEALAREHYGKDYVDQTLSAFNAEFGNNAAIQGRVLSSDAPIVEAIKVMRERKFFSEYGSDPDAIRKKIRDDVEKELRPKIAEEEAKRLAERVTKRDETPTGLAGARGTGDQTAGKPTGPTPLKSIFGA